MSNNFTTSNKWTFHTRFVYKEDQPRVRCMPPSFSDFFPDGTTMEEASAIVPGVWHGVKLEIVSRERKTRWHDENQLAKFLNGK